MNLRNYVRSQFRNYWPGLFHSPFWLRFVVVFSLYFRCSRQLPETKRSLVHTELGFLSPPKPSDKSRWQNLDAYVKWAEMVLKQKVKSMPRAEAEKFGDKLSWLKEYKPHILEWRIMLDILNTVKIEVKINGFSKQTRDKFNKTISSIKINSLRSKNIRDEVFAYIENECAGIKGVYPGCSDIIESVFGKYKNFSGKSPMKEIGRAVLTIPVFTSNFEHKEVKDAMESISAKDVSEWLKENVGTSLFTKRKQAFKLKKQKVR